MANRKPPQPRPMREQAPNNPRLGIEIPLGLPEHLPEQEQTPSPVAPDENDDMFFWLLYRVDVESLNDWATVTQFMRRSIGFAVQKTDVYEDLKHFLIIMFGSNWEKGFWLTEPWSSSNCKLWLLARVSWPFVWSGLGWIISVPRLEVNFGLNLKGSSLLEIS